jgi:hypothetical protein
MAGIDRTQECERLCPSYLTDHQAIGAHAKARPQQLVNANPRFAKLASNRNQPERIRVREHDLRRVLDHDQAAVPRDFLQQRIQECRLAGARTT